MAIRQLDDLLYEAQVGPATLTAITSVMSDADKARWLQKYTSWPDPEIGRDGVIEVRDPEGFTHYIAHDRVEEMDVFTCRRHGSCWACHSAIQAYNYNSGIAYEQATGDDFHHLRLMEERPCQ